MKLAILALLLAQPTAEPPVAPLKPPVRHRGEAPPGAIVPVPTYTTGETGVDERVLEGLMAPPVGDLSGYYSCVGKSPNGKPYDAVVVVQKLGDVYGVSWAMGAQLIMGVGIRNGETLSVGWSVTGPDGRTVRGVNRYTIHGRRMVGRWATIPGPGAMGEETLDWLKEKLPEEEP